MFLNRERGATGLLLALHLQWKRPIRFVVRNDQWTDSRFQLDNQGGAPWEVLTMFSGALIDLLQHSMLCTSSKRCSSVVLTSGGEGSDAVIQPKKILDPPLTLTSCSATTSASRARNARPITRLRRSQSGLAGPSTLKVTHRRPTGSAVTVEVNHSSAGSSTSCASHLSRGGMLPLLLPCETVLEEASRRTMLA